LVGKFGKEEGVQAIKDNYLAAQRLGSLVEINAASEAFYARLRGCEYYYGEVFAEVRGLIEETRNATGSAELPRTTNAVSSTRLDFAVHGIWQVPPPEHREDSSNEDAIEAMRMSSKNGGYKLAGFEALYRG